MSDLPRYMWIQEANSWKSYLQLHADGPYVRFADVSLHLQQLEAENVRLLRALKEREISDGSTSDVRGTETAGAVTGRPFAQRFEMTELETLRAALAETRDALQQLTESQEFYEAMQTYRHAPMMEPEEVVEAFDAVKALILARVAAAS